MRLYSTVCFKDWPHHYVTYYQEIKPPYRRSTRAHVFRVWTFGLVVVAKWTAVAADEEDALMYGIGARVLPMDEDLNEDLHTLFSPTRNYVSKRRHQEL